MLVFLIFNGFYNHDQICCFFLPILVSVTALLVNFIHGSAKNKTGIIDALSKELSNNNPNPYVVQACISRIHSSRPIPATVLKITLLR